VPEVNIPVLVGGVPLMYVQKMTINEGYKLQRIGSSKFVQGIAPTTKTITIEATLIGQGRLGLKKGLEAMALVSRASLAVLPFVQRFIAGVPVVSGLTISLDMQVTNLNFVQSTQKREALDAVITLEHVPRSSFFEILGEVADLALAIGSAAVATGPPTNTIPRAPQRLGSAPAQITFPTVKPRLGSPLPPIVFKKVRP
jgi:hypothetical protein